VSFPTLAPLPIAVPLFVAALLVAGSPIFRRRFLDTVAVATAAAVTVVCVLLVLRTTDGIVPTWFGGWTPRDGVAIGISLAVDPTGAALATLASLLVTAALVFSWRYFETVGALFHALMLVFLSAMCGFALTGDLFNMFVFFELMSVAAYALTGYKIEERAPLQGALNFAVTNSVGGFMVLLGTGLLYGRTGALNLAQLGESLAGAPADGLVITAYTLLVVGFLVKAAAVPFHFWLADAHAVAPTPVCVIFSGVMVELGVYAVARVHGTVFTDVVGSEVLTPVLLALGVVTAVVGSVMCFVQRHLKRLLAFSTVGHAGLFLTGVALLTAESLAGAGLYIFGHGLVKGALFICVGIVLHRLGGIDEDDLRGRGRRIPYTGLLFALGGLGLAGLPLLGTATGKHLIEHAAEAEGYGWLAAVFVFTSVLTGGAVLRAAGRLFLGWGPREATQSPAEEEARMEERETRGGRRRTPAVMAAPAAALLAISVVAAFWSDLPVRAHAAGELFLDRTAYADAVLRGVPAEAPAPVPAPEGGLILALVGVAGAAGLALFALLRKRLPESLCTRVWALARPPITGLRRVHSGLVSDYVAWLVVGTTALGAALVMSAG
jgi:multicomponent Na+:H+ antiporter subunit D